jgi:hypothetical protein
LVDAARARGVAVTITPDVLLPASTLSLRERKDLRKALGLGAPKRKEG